RISSRDGHARLKQRQLKEVAPVERQRVHLLASDDAVNLVLFFIDDRITGLNLYDFVLRAYAQGGVAGSRVADLNLCRYNLSSEVLSLYLHFVLAGQKRFDSVDAVAARVGFSYFSCNFTGNRDGSIRNDSP